MDKRDLLAAAIAFVGESELNRVPEAAALRPDLAGLRLCEAPILGFASARDPLFAELRRPGVIGPHFRPPAEWLPEAATVVSYFLPFSDRIIVSNRQVPDWPSLEWLHGRIEGQRLIDSLSVHLEELLRRAGHPAVAPAISPDFWSRSRPAGRRDDGELVPGFTSNWSERHVAHVAGLGTFGLAAGLITEKGTAGRLGSVVTALGLEPDPRPYARHDEYCSQCGACARRCFAGAITPGLGKDKAACSAATAPFKEKHKPYYGCGKCHVAVPCERGIPGR